MPFCTNCGAEYAKGSKFCNKCGAKLDGTAGEPNNSQNNNISHDEKVIWSGKPSGISGMLKEKAHVNATEYVLTNQRVIIKTGLIGKKQEEIELLRVKDIRVKQTLKDRALQIGSIEIISTDDTTPDLLFEEVKNPNDVKEKIRSAVRSEKSLNGMKYQEML